MQSLTLGGTVIWPQATRRAPLCAENAAPGARLRRECTDLSVAKDTRTKKIMMVCRIQNVSF